MIVAINRLGLLWLLLRLLLVRLLLFCLLLLFLLFLLFLRYSNMIVAVNGRRLRVLIVSESCFSHDVHRIFEEVRGTSALTWYGFAW